jgi:hypothetical protein
VGKGRKERKRRRMWREGGKKIGREERMDRGREGERRKEGRRGDSPPPP